jgi:hypothetical protein
MICRLRWCRAKIITTHIKKIKFHHKIIVFDQAIGNDQIHEAKVKKQPL